MSAAPRTSEPAGSAMPEPPVFGVRRPGVHYRVRPGAYAIVPDPHGALAVLRTPLGWFLPGGGRDDGEAPADTVVREGVEEAGLRLAPEGILGEATEWVHAADAAGDDAGWEKRSTFLLARVTGTAAAVEPDHVLEWIPAAEAARVLTPPTHRWIVERWMTEAAR